MLHIFWQLEEISMGPKADDKVDDKVDDEADNEVDDEEVDTAGMSELEDEQEAAKRQQGQGLKMLTPQQMITRLLILLAQLKAGNNSQKLKNEIKQLLYSLYR